MIYTAHEAAKVFNLWALMVPKQIQKSLAMAAELVKKEAESYIGHPQTEWAPLADSTEERKDNKGEPLLREGDMKASIRMKVMPWEAVVYSNNRAMWFHETGTKYMPKRGVLSLALYRNEFELHSLLGKGFFTMMFKTPARGQ